MKKIASLLDTRTAARLAFTMLLGRCSRSLGLVAWIACGCGSSGDDAQTPRAVTFRNDVAPIFEQGCVLCHHGPDNGTHVDLSNPFDPNTGIIGRVNSWTSAPSTLLVDPGHVENSFLIDKVERTDLDPHIEGSPMPWNIPPLDATEIASIRQWIQTGALNDASFLANVAPIFGDGMSLGARGGKCAYCHYAGTLQPPDLTHPFDLASGVVNVTGTRGTRVIPNDPDGSLLVKKIEAQATTVALGAPMPYQQAPLSKSQIDTLKSWIAAGAKND